MLRTYFAFLISFLAFAKPCKPSDFLNDPGFRSTNWVFNPGSFQTSNSGATGIQVPDGGYILLALTYISSPSYGATIGLDLPDDVSSVNLELTMQTSANSSHYFNLDIGLAGEIWRITDSELTLTQGELVTLNSTLAVNSVKPEFSIQVGTAAVENQWLAITDVKVIGCSSENLGGLLWWEDLLIVLGVLVFCGIAGYFIYHGIGLQRRNSDTVLLPK